MTSSRVFVFLISLLILLSACSKNEFTMKNLITIDSLYTPGGQVLPGSRLSEYDNYIRLAGIDTIYGSYTDGGRILIFHSFDGLKTSFVYEMPYGFEILYFEKGNIIIHQKGSGCKLQESTDFGKTFTAKIIKEPAYREAIYTPVFTNLNCGYFINFLGITIEIYKITGSDYQKICTINPDFNQAGTPKLPFMIDADNWCFVNFFESTFNRSYIYHSSDGGYSWQKQLIEQLPPLNNYHEFLALNFLKVISKTKYVFYQLKVTESSSGYIETMEFYYSYDAGVNWVLKDFVLPGYSKSIQFVNENVGFILVQSSYNNPANKATIYKSTDSGETWKALGKEVYAHDIYFSDENHGIAKYNDVVQVTLDGGKTWKLLTYSVLPYN